MRSASFTRAFPRQQRGNSNLQHKLQSKNYMVWGFFGGEVVVAAASSPPWAAASPHQQHEATANPAPWISDPAASTAKRDKSHGKEEPMSQCKEAGSPTEHPRPALLWQAEHRGKYTVFHSLQSKAVPKKKAICRTRNQHMKEQSSRLGARLLHSLVI